MVPAKRLNLSKTHDDESSTLCSDDEQEKHATAKTPEEEAGSSSDEDSEAEFEIPPGFERIKGSSALTREAVFNDNQELWFFKLPKNLDASVLANVTIKLQEDNAATVGKGLATVTTENATKKYVLQSEDRMLKDQLVNALPLASDRTRFVLGKPFARCFSLVEDYVDQESIATQEAIETPRGSEKRPTTHAAAKRVKKHRKAPN